MTEATEPEITWDNVRPTEAVRLARSPYQQGREDERAAVLAWLLVDCRDAALTGRQLASLINGGEHLKPRQPETA